MGEIRDAPRELLALAVEMRPDWDRDETWAALLACKAANWPWKRTLTDTVRLLLTEDSSPADLRYAAGDTRLPRPGTPLTKEEREEIRRQAIASCEAANEHFRHQAKAGDAA